MTEAVSHADSYDIKSSYAEDGDVVHEIENTSEDLTDIITLSYDNEGQMYARLIVE
jgi:adenine-specific DNA methylase